MTITELHEELWNRIQQLDQALAFLRKVSGEWSEADTAYRKKKAEVFLTSKGTDGQRKMRAEAECAELMEDAHTKDGLKQAALEAVRSRRSQISAIQSLVGGYRAEAEFARTGPDFTGREHY